MPAESDEPLGRGLTNKGSWLRARTRAAGSVREEIDAAGPGAAYVATIWVTNMCKATKVRSIMTFSIFAHPGVRNLSCQMAMVAYSRRGRQGNF